MAELTFVRDDALPHASGTAYRIHDAAGRLRGVVAGAGGYWVAGRIMPSRTRLYGGMVAAETRAEAARRLVEGRP